MKQSKVVAQAIVLASAIQLAPRVAHACAMCGLPAGDHAIHAYNSSVLFMLSAPYVICGAIGTIVYLAYRSARRRRLFRAAGGLPASAAHSEATT